jgi:Glycosyl transferase family 2
MTLTYLVPTIGRETLSRTLASIAGQQLPGDETLVVGATEAIQATADAFRCRYVYCDVGGNYGATERMRGLPLVRTDYLTFLDDDDVAAPGARARLADVLARVAGHPVIGRMQYASGLTLWVDPALRCGNVGSPMFVLPNRPERFGTWTGRYEGDFDFIRSCQWAPTEYCWSTETLALVRP